MYITCFYRDNVLVLEREFKTRDDAEFAALDGFKFGAEVSIYTPAGKMLKNWNRRSA